MKRWPPSINKCHLYLRETQVNNIKRFITGVPNLNRNINKRGLAKWQHRETRGPTLECLWSCSWHCSRRTRNTIGQTGSKWSGPWVYLSWGMCQILDLPACAVVSFNSLTYFFCWCSSSYMSREAFTRIQDCWKYTSLYLILTIIINLCLFLS